MKLSWKIQTAAVTAVGLTAIACLSTVYITARSNRIESLHEEMSGMLAQADSVIDSMDDMHTSNAFDNEGMLDEALEKSGGRPLKATYRSTSFYKTIPVVSAWNSVEAMAERYGFEFLITTAPGIPARNPTHEFGDRFDPIFAAFQKGETDYFRHDSDEGVLIAARPVNLRQSCLDCHGDPSTSASGDGLDILGFKMENMKLGDTKGAFILRSELSHDPVVAATMTKATIVCFAVLIVVSGGIYFFNNRYIAAPIRRAIERLQETTERSARSSGAVSRASETLASGASEQAASIEETVSSLETLAQMTRSNSEATFGAKSTTENAREAAEGGAKEMRKMIQTMNTIKDSSDNISHILKTIDEIAFQTNILALNAAVEAARAGEAGSGFAVVADEVRSLAQRSAAAANETATKVQESIANSQMGVEVSQEVNENLEAIIKNVEEVDTVMATIAQSSQEQSEGIDQINRAMNEMNKVTQSNASDAEDTSNSSIELRSQGDELRRLIDNLRVLVDGPDAVENAISTPVASREFELDSVADARGRSHFNASSDRASESVRWN